MTSYVAPRLEDTRHREGPQPVNFISELKERVRVLTQENTDWDFETLLDRLLEKRRRIYAVAFTAALIGVVVALVLPPLFTTGITMYPSSSRATGGLAGLQGIAANLGLNIGAELGQEYSVPEVLESRVAMNRLVHHEWETNAFDGPVDLIVFWEFDDTGRFSLTALSDALRDILSRAGGRGAGGLDVDAIRREERAVERLRSRITVDEDNATGLVRARVWMEERQLAVDVSYYLAEVAGEIVAEMNNAVESQNRQFIAERMVDVKAELVAQEATLTAFRERNRFVQSSPQLQLEEERLLRDVRLQTELYLTLSQQYELARIEEVRRESPLVVLDNPQVPALKDKPRRKVMVILFFIGGTLIGMAWLLARLFWNEPQAFIRDIHEAATH